MKRVLGLLMTLVLMAGMMTAVSAENKKLPNAVWPLFDDEVAYEASGNVQALIETREAIIALFGSWDDTSTQKLDIVTPRYRKIAEGYETLLDYDSMNAALDQYIYYAGLQEIYGGWTHDAVIWAEAKKVNSDVNVTLFMETESLENSVYYGAKFEPVSGTYFGSVYDRDDRIERDAGIGTYDWSYVSRYFPKQNSINLIYLEFGDNIRTFDRYYKSAEAAGAAIELAWNTSTTYSDMSSYKSYIQTTADYIAELSVPVFVRYGAEMNITEGMENASQYVANYKYIADIMRATAPNAVMLWSANDVTETGRSLKSYYPGDEYVDWVGISTYTYYYFGDQTDWGTQQDSIDNRFFTGPYANPLSKVAEVIETFGDRKPIMISESGVAHYSKVAGEDMTDWATTQLERQYAFMPLLYPQVKSMVYFNVDDGITPRNSYALYTNSTIADRYNTLVADDQYLTSVGDSASTRFAEVGSRRDVSVRATGSTLTLKAYTIVPGTLEPTVIYSIDGGQVGSTMTIPYETSVSTTGISTGTHTLTVDVYNGSGQRVTQETYTLIKDANGVLVEAGTHNQVSFGDVDGHWSKDYVLEIAKRGIITGSEGSYRPKASISRAEMATIITKLGNLSKEKSAGFSDVSSTKWYYDYVNGASDFLTGYGNTYYPEREASREEIITALVKLKGYHVQDVTADDRQAFQSRFSDYSSIDSNNVDWMILAVRYGIVGGYEDGTLRPDASMTRGEVAKVLYSTFFQ